MSDRPNMANIRNIREKQELCELTPWYVNGTLSASEQRQVADHLPHCADCQNTVALFSLIQQSAVQQSTVQHSAAQQVVGELVQSGESGDQAKQFQKLLARIELDTTEQADHFDRAPMAAEKQHRYGLFSNAKHYYSLAAALSFLLVGGLTFITLNTSVFDLPKFHTLSDAAASAIAVPGAKQFRVLFHRDTTDTQIQLILAEINAQMVAGPSPRGVYTIQVAADMKKTTDEILLALRDQIQVVLAEPVIE